MTLPYLDTLYQNMRILSLLVTMDTNQCFLNHPVYTLLLSVSVSASSGYGHDQLSQNCFTATE